MSRLLVSLRSPTGVWLVLVAATLLSYVSWTDASLADTQITGSAVVIIATFKAWVIGMRFMELDEAIWPLRLIFHFWIIAVGAMLLTMFWLTP